MLKEYRICMPMTVEEYRIGQLYMIARHSADQSDDNGEGVETIVNEPCEDDLHGKGQYAEKRIHLTSKLPNWIRSRIPRFIYITEKSWNYYPYTVTEYTCSIIPKFSIKIWTRYENNKGTNDNVHAHTGPDEPVIVDHVNIATDPVRAHQYKQDEDPCICHSVKTDRGPLGPDWRDTCQPIMCSYKLVHVYFPVFGLQGRVEDFVHKEIRNINVLAHRQAVAWLDEWYGWSLSDVRDYEARMQRTTNEKLRQAQQLQMPVSDSSEMAPHLNEEGNVLPKTSIMPSSSVPVTPTSSNLTPSSSGSITPSSGNVTPSSGISTPSSSSFKSNSGGATPQKQGGYFSSFFKWS